MCLATAADSAGVGGWLLKQGLRAGFCCLLLLSYATLSNLIQFVVMF